MISKKELRKELMTKRLNMTFDEVKKKSIIIIEKIIEQKIYRNAKTIMVYMPIKNEVAIEALIESAWADQKIVLFPKVNPITKMMDVYKVTDWNGLEKGNYGIPEPKIGGIPPFPVEEIDVVLIPGVGFDEQGFRLGYGGGYYDRFFDRFEALPYKIGVAFEMQVINQLPVEHHDYPVDEVITERRNVIKDRI